MPLGVSLVFLLTLFPRCISRGCLQPYLVLCHWPRQSCLFHAKVPSSLLQGFSSHFLSFLDFAFLSFHLEDNHASASIKKERLCPTNKARREANQNKFVGKGRMPGRVESFREINNSENRPRARPGFVKPI